MAIFVVQKFVFMGINSAYGGEIGVGDWLSVVWHGLRLDMVQTCYLMIVPILVCLVGSFFRTFPLRRVLCFWYVPLSFVLALTFLADAVLYNFWGAKLDVADLMYAKNPKDMLASLSWGVLLGMFVVLALVVMGQYLLFRRLTPTYLDKPFRRWGTLPIYVIMLGVDVLGMRGGLQESTANPSYAYFSNNQFLNHAALNPLFNMIHSMSKGEDLENQFVFFDEKELAEIVNPMFQSGDDISDTLLVTNKPNIILLIWEGGGSLFTENDTIAPNFVNLRSEGVYFSNLYANNFRTDRGLVSLLNGWPALPTTSVMKMSGKCKALPSLAKNLKAKGYHSAFYYGGDIDFTNMRGYLFETGYDQVYGGDHYADIPVRSKWGIDDEYLLQTIPGDLPPEPFFASCLTLSSHEPWEVPFYRLEDAKANAFAYTDSCLAQLVETLKSMPLWKNLLLIIVPDHGVAAKGYKPSDIAVSLIPMLWLGGAVQGGKVVDRMMNQSDVAATLLCQLGLDVSPFPFSRNVISLRYKPAVLMHAYKNGFNLIDTLGYSQFGIVNDSLMPNGALHSAQAERDAQALLQLIYTRTAEL